MLQRAASNAYSWWWASHIRTKQSKWMEQHLIDFQEKVEAVMKLLQEDGDSFAKRAEMYYKGRPELINFVEESYRAYRALAERYDHISKELQNANNTIASICPEQVPFMDEDDEDGSPKASRKAPEGFKPSNAAPKVPKPPRKDLKTVITSATKNFCTNKKVVSKAGAPKEPIKSGLSKKEALEEIDKLQKQILTLQTVKEFVKSTYDNAIQKYWDTEEEIKRLQERVSLLHDEFGEGMVIEDDVARRLMTEAALKTCQETLTRLRVKQERSFDETKIENKRVKAVREKLESLMHKLHYDQVSRPEPKTGKNVKQMAKDLDQDIEKMNQQRQELQLLQNRIKEQIAAGSSGSISVSEMAEKIDELVNKVISLETSISSQDALVTRLRAETDELQSQIVYLEDDRSSLIDEKNDLTAKLREMDEKMQVIQDLNEMVETQNTDLQTHFTEALCDLDHLSEEVPIAKPDKRDEIPDLSKRESEPSGEAISNHEVQRQDEGPTVKPDERDKIPTKRESEPSSEAVSKHEVQRQHEVPNVKPDERAKIPDLSNRESEALGEAVPEHEVQRQDECPIVKPDERAKIPDLSKRESEALGEAVPEHEVQRQDEVSIVKPDERAKIPDLSKREREPLVEAVPGHEVQRPDALNQENLSINDLESDKKPKVAGLEDNDVQKDNKIGAADFADDNVQKDNKIDEISLGKDRETNVTGSVDNEMKVTDSLQNETRSDNEHKVTESSEKEEASSTGGQSRFNVFKSHITNFISLTQMKPKEQEKTPSPGNNSPARSASSIATGDQDLSQHKESEEANSYSESSRDQQEKNATQSTSETENAHEVHSQKQATAKDDGPNWRQLFMDGMKDKEKLLLTEYTNILRNYKDVKKTLSELEKQNQEILFDTSLKLKELKSSNALKDEEIKLLRQKLGLMERSFEGNKDLKELRATEEPVKKEEEDDYDMEILKVHQPDSTSAIEEKFRRSIDEILEENLGFWLKFSTTFTEIQRFETTIKDLQSDVTKLEESGKSESVRQSMKSEARPIFKHLVEIQTELSVWLEKGASLKEELQRRSSSLCEIQEEITKALKASAEDYDFKFTSYQAAKFQGEVLNMKQENNKVADELQAGLDHVSGLQSEVEKVLAKMGEQFGLTSSKKQRNTEIRHSDSSGSGNRSHSQVPLGAFIFGVKPKKQKHSIFSGISPGMHRKYRAAIKGQYL
ncbi:protein NETWORKED 2D-like [Neltuma alba]|uniref:protein NETWORKED 2D-like n=1 Tax=Neltuma alba TaxID=207710 RepID=UPI0010A569A9|nr:protein NETWORKED 2D-like [Prosopis alba]